LAKGLAVGVALNEEVVSELSLNAAMEASLQTPVMAAPVLAFLTGTPKTGG